MVSKFNNNVRFLLITQITVHGTHEHVLSHGLKINNFLTSTYFFTNNYLTAQLAVVPTNLEGLAELAVVAADPTNLEGLAERVVVAVDPTNLEDLAERVVVAVDPTNLEGLVLALEED
jgi:hypothetical protein